MRSNGTGVHVTVKNEIPGLVRAQIQVHQSEAMLRLERVRAELDRTTVTAARGRVLRGLRGQLEAQLSAWEYLAELTRTGEHYTAHQDVNE